MKHFILPSTLKITPSEELEAAVASDLEASATNKDIPLPLSLSDLLKNNEKDNESNGEKD